MVQKAQKNMRNQFVLLSISSYPFYGSFYTYKYATASFYTFLFLYREATQFTDDIQMRLSATSNRTTFMLYYYYVVVVINAKKILNNDDISMLFLSTKLSRVIFKLLEPV